MESGEPDEHAWDKSCRDCGQTKPLTQFSPAARSADGRATYCKPCMVKRSGESRQRRAAQGGARTQDVLPEDHKRCPDCGAVKPSEEFPRNKRYKDGRHPYCKPCHRARGKESYTRLHGSTRNYHLKARYGITSAEYDDMLERQGGLCALCRERPAEHVDHDHLHGHVRGLLCSCCNQGLGNFRDELAHLKAAVDYLERTTWIRHQRSPGVYRLTSPRPAAAASPSSSALQHLISSRRG